MILFALSSCGRAAERDRDQLLFIVSIEPLGHILRELTGGRGEVKVLLPVGASSHFFEPRPSDAIAAANAIVLFFVSEGLDGWASRLPARNRVEVLSLIPEDKRFFLLPSGLIASVADRRHLPVDPHFWTCPTTVASVIDPLVEVLVSADPDGQEIYLANAEHFRSRIAALDRELDVMLQPLAGKSVIMGHPSFNYFFRRFRIDMAGALETAPGREPSPRHLQNLIRSAQTRPVIGIFNEPQIPMRATALLAAETGLRVYEVEPYGGTPETATWEQFFLHNAQIFLEAAGSS